MVDVLEKNINRFLSKWYGPTQSLSSIALYSQFTKLHLSLSDLSEEFKVIHPREVMMYRNLVDIKVASAGISYCV